MYQGYILPPKKEHKAQHRLRERHTHSATVIAQRGACNNYAQRYRGCSCCLMDIESLVIRRPFGPIDPNSIRETELHTECRRRQSFTQSADADGRGKLAITLLLLLKLLENNTIKSSTEKQSSAIIVHKAKRTATSTRTIHTRQNKPYRLGAAPAGIVGARSRCCPAATAPAAVVFASQETCGSHGRAYEFRQNRQPWKIIHDEG